MATARKVVKAALRDILSSGDTEEPTASEMADGLEALNDFMDSLPTRGVYVSHQTLALDDSLNVDAAHIETIQNKLSVKLAPQFGAAVAPQIAFDANEGMKAFRADTRLARTTPVDSALLRTNRRW